MDEADPASDFRGRKERSELHLYTSHLPSGQYFLRLKLGNWDDIFKCPENPNCTDVCFIEEKFRAHRGFTEKYFNKYFLITYTVVGTWCLRDMDVVKTDKTHWLHGSYILLGWNANVYIYEDQTFTVIFGHYRASLVAQTVKNLPVMWETQVLSLGGEAPLEKGMATHSSIIA